MEVLPTAGRFRGERATRVLQCNRAVRMDVFQGFQH